MLVFFITILCGGFAQIANAQIGKPDDFDYSSTPPRNVFLKDIDPEFRTVYSSLRIVNGQTATRGQFCYQVFIQFYDDSSSWSCGGSLVTPQVVLTAAHCVQGATSAKVTLGGLDLSQKSEPGRQVVQVSSSGLRYHEEYDSIRVYNDIAVVKLPQAVQLNKYICTVQLPSCSDQLTTDSDNNNNCTISGWGKISDRTTTSKLKYATVAPESQSSCSSYFKMATNYKVIESQMCTSGSGGKSICNGDSGGPLTQPDSDGNFIQRGIVSVGLRSCQLSAPSVFTDLTYFMDWLCPQL